MSLWDIFSSLGDLPRLANLGYSTLAGNRTPLTPEQEELLRRYGYLPEEGESPQLMPSHSSQSYRSEPRTLSSEYTVPFEKPSRYSGGYSEKFSSGGTLNIGKMTPDWAPRDSSDVDAEQLGSILTTSALQSLVTNKPVNPQYGIGMAAIRNALTNSDTEDRLGRESESDLEYKNYLRDLEKRGKITAKERLDYLVKTATSTTTPLGAEPTVVSELLRQVGVGTSGKGLNDPEVAPAGTPLPKGLASAPRPTHPVTDKNGVTHYGYVEGEPGWLIEGGYKVKGRDGQFYWVVD